MPGNEVGDRVHNFFEQDSDREKGNQFSLGPYGLNFTQQNLRPEFVKNPSHQQQSNLNGFMHIPQTVHTKQNEANFLGVDAEPDRHTLTSRGLSILESQHRSGSPHAHSARFGGSESPMNFNFLSGQQQMSGQQPGMLQSLPRQQFAFNDAQLLPQQVMLKQMQELQRQKQFQQLDTMQRNVVSHIPAFPNQMVGQHSLAVNANPMYDTSNYPWSSQAMAGNTHWSQRGPSLPMQGYPNGLMITPEQGQPMRFMGLTQQASQSLYGVPVSSSRNANTLSLNSTDKPGVPQVSAPSNSFSSDSQYAQPPEQVSMQDETIASRHGSEGKNSYEHGYSQGLENVVGFGSFNQMQQTNVPISESGRHDSAGGSEMLPEKSVNPNNTKQDAVALDPTEEKFLFGSDENIWDAFGSDVDRLDGPADLSNGLPLLQSGTWSALMQSAVAETSSTDVGIQEEWSGLGYQNTKSQSGNLQSSVCEDNVKEQPIWVDRSQRISLGLQNTTSNVNSSGLQQRFPNQPRQSLPTENQILPEGRKWLDGNQLMPQTGKNWALENANPSQDFPKTDTGFWSNQQRTFLQDNSDQSSGRPNVLNFIESVPANGSTTLADQDNLHDEDHNRHISMDASHSATLRSESISDYKVDRGNPRVHSVDAAVAPSLGNVINRQYSQDFPGNRNLDIWKSVTSSAQYGYEGSGKEQHNLNKGLPILESSVTVPDGIAAEMHETRNGDVGGSSNDSHRSSFRHPAGRLRESVWSDVGDQRNLHVGKEKPSEQAGKRAPVTRKFQYHPMGDLDMDVDSCSYASKETMHSQLMPPHFSSGVRGHETPARFLGQSGTNSKDLEGCVFQRVPQISDGVGIQHGQCPNTSMPFVKSSEVSSNHQKLSPSQNMLELLHKVDQSKELASVSNISSTDGNGSSGSVRLSQSQSSTSHGFNLQLAPPSQAVAPSSLNIAIQSSSPMVDSPSSGFGAFEKGDKGHAWLVSVSSAQYSPSSHPPPQMGSGNDRSGISGSMDADVSHLKGNPSPLASGSSYLRGPIQHDHKVAAGGKMIADQSSLSFGWHANLNNQTNDSQDQTTARQSVSDSLNSLASGRGMNRFGLRASMHQMPMSSLGMPRNDNLSPSGAKMWFQQQQLMGAQARNTAELLQSQFQSNDAVSSQGIVGGEEPVLAEAQPTGKTSGESEEEEPVVKHPSDVSPTNSAVNQKDSEAFHHSLKPNNTTQHGYSLHQMHAMKSMVADPSHHESKRLKGTNYIPDAQNLSGKVEHTFSGGLNMVRDPSIGQTSIQIGDANMLNISPQSVNRISSFQSALGMCTSRETLSLDPSDPQKVTSIAEHGGINPQMVPSWFQQYGTFKNGQSLSVHNVPRRPVVKNADQQFIGGKTLNSVDGCDSMQLVNVTSDSGQIANDFRTTSIYPSEHVTSLDALVPRVCNPTSASIRPKKRKTATSDLMSWSKEIGLGFIRLQSMSSAEVDWAKSSNRVVEKVEEETGANEEILRTSRPKRRLTLTTQLMQQVFRSPSPALLSVVASCNHEMIMYSLARLTAGDACSLICCLESDSPVQLGSENLVLGKVKKSSEPVRDQYFSEVIEDFINRTKELESGLLRLDKRASILDFRLDLQDLERFSVISRFARFHGRVQVDGAESSLSSSDPNVVIQRPCPQRYVSAHPMPKNIPDRVQCLSL